MHDETPLRTRRATAAWTGAAVVAIGGLAGVVLMVSAGRRPLRAPELDALVEAVGAARPIEPRLAGGFAYGPQPSPKRSAGTASTTPVDLRLAAARIEKSVVNGRTAENLHYLGVAHLLTGNIDKGVAALEEAATKAAADATLMNDLAAAYLVRGANVGRREDVARAASRAEAATRLDSSFAEAYFNRGLAFEALSLQRDARDSWERYLLIDSVSPWADEARRHLHALTGRTTPAWTNAVAALRDGVRCRDQAMVAAAIDASPTRTWEYLEDELLPSWADSFLAGAQEKASQSLACARGLADVFASRGDLMGVDAVGAVERASRGQRGTAAALARAHQGFRGGSRLFEESRFKEAESAFESARRAMVEAGSRFDVEAASFAVRCLYREQRIPEALAALNRLIEVATSRHYWHLAARLHRLRGVIQEGRSQFAAVIEDYRVASTLYDRARDAENSAGIHNLLAQHLQTIGEPRESWDHLFWALASLPDVSSPLSRYQILLVAIQKCLHDALPDVALHFQNAFLDNALTWPGAAATGATTNAYVQRARVLRQLGDLQAAERDVREARRALADVRDHDLADRWSIEIALAAAENWQATRPSDAVTALTEAITKLEGAGTTMKLPNLLLLRGRANLSIGDRAQAEEDFRRGIEAFESQHGTVGGQQSRISHYDESWDVFTEMIRFQLQQRKRTDLALAYVERGRARTLLESVTRRVDPPRSGFDLAAVQRRLPDNVVVLSFAALNDDLVTWIVTGRSIAAVQRTTSLDELTRITKALRGAITSRNEDAEPLLADLYDLLIRPVRGQLDSDATLVIVPDGPLSDVPFAALIDRTTGRYLTEQHTIAVAPSLAVFVEMSDRLRAREAGAVSRVLVVGDPAINRADYPNLATLDGAAEEALEVARIYRGAELLTRQNATKARFLEAIRRSEIVHFAGHAVANPEFPWLSRLLFAPGSESGSDTLFSYELTDQRLDQLRLVVLAACSTGTAAGARGEGALSLARSFLAAGAPAVVASMWDIGDSASQHLFSTFYERLRSGASPVTALHDAQLAALHSREAADRLPANWAGYAVFGGLSGKIH